MTWELRGLSWPAFICDCLPSLSVARPSFPTLRLYKMSVSKTSEFLLRQHPLQRLPSPDRGTSALVHVRIPRQPRRANPWLTTTLVAWTSQFPLFFQIVGSSFRKQKSEVWTNFPRVSLRIQTMRECENLNSSPNSF